MLIKLTYSTCLFLPDRDSNYAILTWNNFYEFLASDGINLQSVH